MTSIVTLNAPDLISQVLLDVEADSYWCLTKLMDNIQDRYTFSQVNTSHAPHMHCISDSLLLYVVMHTTPLPLIHG